MAKHRNPLLLAGLAPFAGLLLSQAACAGAGAAAAPDAPVAAEAKEAEASCGAKAHEATCGAKEASCGAQPEGEGPAKEKEMGCGEGTCG